MPWAWVLLVFGEHAHSAGDVWPRAAREMKDRANEGLVWNAFHLLAFLVGLGCVLLAEGRAAEVGSGSWCRVEVIEASKDVLGVPRLVQLDGAVWEALDGHAEVDVVVV